MTVKSSFFWNGPDEYGEEELGAAYSAMIRPGVKVDDDNRLCFEVTKSSGTTVSVAPGIAYLNGAAWLYKDGSTPLTITPDGTFTRIDRVVLYADFIAKTTGIELKQGVAGSNPYAPVLKRDSQRFELSVARIIVKPSGIDAVVDERDDLTVCGAVRARDTSEFDTYFEVVRNTFEEWFDTQKGAGWRPIYIQEESPPSSAVDGSLWLDIGNGNQLKEYKEGAWTNLYIKPDLTDIFKEDSSLIFGSKMSNDTVVEGERFTLPLATARTGFTYNTDYAELLSDGSVRIKKKGYYHFSANIYISDSPRISGTYHMRIYKRDETPYGLTIGENYVQTSTVNPNNICSGNPSGFEYCEVGDVIALYVAPPRMRRPYRINAKHTHFTVVPYALME